MGMDKREHHFVRRLSGGEMQRTAIARALNSEIGKSLARRTNRKSGRRQSDKVLEIFQRIADERLVVVTGHRNCRTPDWPEKWENALSCGGAAELGRVGVRLGSIFRRGKG